MTGPQHYREAERLLAAQKQPSSVAGCGPVISADADPGAIAAAQVHATLALAAATAAGAGLAERDRQSWDQAIGLPGYGATP